MQQEIVVGCHKPSKDIRPLLAVYLALAAIDMIISYIGVTRLGMVENSRVINYFGAERGVALVFLLSLGVVVTLWTASISGFRILRVASFLAVWMLLVIEFVAIVNNLIFIGAR